MFSTRLESSDRAIESAPAIATRSVVVGVEVPFTDLVVLLVKLALAAIPAMIIVALMVAMFGGMIAGFFGK